MLAGIKLANLALAFLLELCMLAAIGYWGFQSEGLWSKLGLGLGVPLLVIIIWGCFLAPMANWPLGEPWLLLAKILIFGGAVVALFASGQRLLSILFAIIIIVNFMLAYAWGQA